MCLFKKKNKSIDLEQGKWIFFKCKGSSFAIDRDYAEEYWNCNIPKELENIWLKEIESSERKD